jgi:hypothetical protein
MLCGYQTEARKIRFDAVSENLLVSSTREVVAVIENDIYWELLNRELEKVFWVCWKQLEVRHKNLIGNGSLLTVQCMTPFDRL